MDTHCVLHFLSSFKFSHVRVTEHFCSTRIFLDQDITYRIWKCYVCLQCAWLSCKYSFYNWVATTERWGVFPQIIISIKILIWPWRPIPKPKYFSPYCMAWKYGLRIAICNLCSRCGFRTPVCLRSYSDISYLLLGFSEPFHVHTGRPVIHNHRRAIPCNVVLAGQWASVRLLHWVIWAPWRLFKDPTPKKFQPGCWIYKSKEESQERLSSINLHVNLGTCDEAGPLSLCPCWRCFNWHRP